MEEKGHRDSSTLFVRHKGVVDRYVLSQRGQPSNEGLDPVTITGNLDLRLYFVILLNVHQVTEMIKVEKEEHQCPVDVVGT